VAIGAAVVAAVAFAGTRHAQGAATRAQTAGAAGTQTWARRYARTGDDMFTVAYEAATGATLWTRRYGRMAGGADYGRAIRVAPDGGTIFVTGTSESPTGHDYITMAYDADTGALKWRRRFDSTFHLDDDVVGLALSPDASTVFVTGDSTGAGGGYDFATVGYDAATGATRWITRYHPAGSSANYVNGIAVSPDGSKVVVTGQTQNSGSSTFDAVTLAYAAPTGCRLWTTRYDGLLGLDDTANALAFAPGGSVAYVGGSVTESLAGIQPNADFATFALDAATGTQLWLATYDGAQKDVQDVVEALAVSPDGTKVFVTGPSTHDSSSGPYNYDYATVGYASNGSQLWASRYDGPAAGTDFPFDIAVAPNGSQVLVTGRSIGPSGTYDYETIGYTPLHGYLIWQRRQNGAANGDDEARALAVSPDSSKVVVTGTSDGTSAYGRDWLTLVYSTS
jgi:WD40 repeat protein